MIHILSEVPGEAARIRAVHEAAFPLDDAGHSAEADIVDALRADGALTVSIVANEDTEILGHVAASPVRVADTSGWFGIGPVAVVPGRQGEGIGEQLMRAAVEALERLHDARGIVVLGDQGYYEHFGFRPSDMTYLEYPLLSLPLAGEEPSGVVTYHPSFY